MIASNKIIRGDINRNNRLSNSASTHSPGSLLSSNDSPPLADPLPQHLPALLNLSPAPTEERTTKKGKPIPTNKKKKPTENRVYLNPDDERQHRLDVLWKVPETTGSNEDLLPQSENSVSNCLIREYVGGTKRVRKGSKQSKVIPKFAERDLEGNNVEDLNRDGKDTNSDDRMKVVQKARLMFFEVSFLSSSSKI
jgi:hypothetical protein